MFQPWMLTSSSMFLSEWSLCTAEGSTLSRKNAPHQRIWVWTDYWNDVDFHIGPLDVLYTDWLSSSTQLVRPCIWSPATTWGVYYPAAYPPHLQGLCLLLLLLLLYLLYLLGEEHLFVHRSSPAACEWAVSSSPPVLTPPELDMACSDLISIASNRLTSAPVKDWPDLWQYSAVWQQILKSKDLQKNLLCTIV